MAGHNFYETSLRVVCATLLVAGGLFSTQLPAHADTVQLRRSRPAVVGMWREVEGKKKEVPVKKVYPLKSLEDLKEVLFVGAEPYGITDFRSRWEGIFEDYNVQFLDRGTGLNDIGFSFGLRVDPQTVDFTRRNKILIGSYSILHPVHESDNWSFMDNYYKRLPRHEKWRNHAGDIIEDPYKGGGARDILGKVLKQASGRKIIMSLNNPNWFDYQLKSLKFAIDSGINAIDIDEINATPFLPGGDFSEWGIRGFNQYLGSKFTRGELRQMGITDVSRFNIQRYITNAYVKKAVSTVTLPDGSTFFNTEPPDKPLGDPIVREFMKFNYHTLIDFNKRLSSQLKEYGLKKGRVIPYFGNLHIGSPYSIFSANINSMILGQSVDIVQLETDPAIPPKERAIIIYKIGWAMSEGKKPIWSKGFPAVLDRYIPGVTKLYLAESYAAGVIPEIDLGGWRPQGKGGWFVTREGEIYPEPKKYLDFVKNNQEYFKNVEPHSKIGLVYSVPSFMWATFPMFNVPGHGLVKSFVGYARALEEAHLQYDVLTFGMPGLWDDSKTLKELSNYDTLILPNVYSASDEQLRALQGFLRKGGKLICVGEDALSRDEEYRRRDRSKITRVLGGRPGQVIFVDEKDAIKFQDNIIKRGREDVTGFNRLIAPVSYRFKRLLETNAPREVGVNVLRQKDQLIIHFLNYDYDAKSDSFREKRNIGFKLTNKIPIEKVKKVTLISPDREKTLCIENPKSRFFVMPELEIWNTIIVE